MLKSFIQHCKHVLASSLYYCIVLMVRLSLRSEVAILYNDRSVLENHHVSAAYRLMVEEDMNIFVNLNKDDWRWEKTHHARPEAHSNHRTNYFDCIYGFFWQGAEDFGYRDGDVHWHVLSLPADQDHEECPHTDRQVRTENTAFPKSRNLHITYINLTKTLILHIPLHLLHFIKQTVQPISENMADSKFILCLNQSVIIQHGEQDIYNAGRSNQR